MSPHRETHRVIVRAIAIVAVTAAGAAWLAAKGPVKVIVGTTEIDEFAPTWYMLSAFPVLGIVLADVLGAVLDAGLFAKRTVVLGACAALVVAVSNLRLGIRLPVSGHVLLMTYAMVLQSRTQLLGTRPVARTAAVASLVEYVVVRLLFVAVTLIKLLHWHDGLSFGVGAIGGIALAALVVHLLKTPRTPPATDAAR